MTVIYKITNKINGKSYIGQALSIFDRWCQHEKASRNLKNATHFYNTIRKYGLQSFSFDILEIIPNEYTKIELNTA
jgi:group I intron endonuclease